MTFYGIKRLVHVIVSVSIVYHRLDITDNPAISPNVLTTSMGGTPIGAGGHDPHF